MKKVIIMLASVLLLTACGDSEKQLRERAAELCKYIPDQELLEQSRDYLTEDFYQELDTMFNYLPEHEAIAELLKEYPKHDMTVNKRRIEA